MLRNVKRFDTLKHSQKGHDTVLLLSHDTRLPVYRISNVYERRFCVDGDNFENTSRVDADLFYTECVFQRYPCAWMGPQARARLK